jgi:cell division protein FtsX
MKFLPYLLKHLRRNWFRTGLTVLAMAVCIFLFCTLQTVLAAIEYSLQSASASRLWGRSEAAR